MRTFKDQERDADVAQRAKDKENAIQFALWLGENCIQYIDNPDVWTYIKDNNDYDLSELYVIKSNLPSNQK